MEFDKTVKQKQRTVHLVNKNKKNKIKNKIQINKLSKVNGCNKKVIKLN
jgi:hypothetical protein